MAGPIQNSNMEEMDCVSFFDHMDDLLDFPMNDEDFEAGLTAKIDPFPSIWSTESDSVFSNPKSDLSAQLSVPVSPPQKTLNSIKLDSQMHISCDLTLQTYTLWALPL